MSVRLAVVASLLGSITACGDSRPPRPSLDAAVGDAARDSAVGDASGTDAGIDAGGDANVNPGVTVRCSLGGSTDLVTATGSLSDMEIDLAAGATDALVVARVRTVADYPEQRIVAIPLSDATVGATSPISTFTGGTVRMPAVAPRGAGFVAAWADNRGAMSSLDLHTRDLDVAGVPTATPVRRTIGAGADDSIDVVDVGGNSLIAWVERNVGTTVPRIALYDSFGSFSTMPADLSATAGFVVRPALAEIGDVPFAAFRGSDGRMKTSEIAADATSASSPVTVSMGTMVTDDWDFASSFAADEGAIVFGNVVAGTRFTVSFRHLDADGGAQLAEPTLSGDVDQGIEPSIAPLTGGYIVAYRHRTQAGVVTLRVLLVDAFGTVVDMDDSAAIPDFEGDVRVAVSADQQPYLVYEQTTTATIPGDVNPTPAVVLRSIPITCGAP